MARMEGIPEIVREIGLVRFGTDDLRSQVDQVADEVLQGLVIIDQESVLLLVKRREVVGIIFEERTHVIGGDECVPMQMAPVPMVGDTDIACQDFRCRRFFDGYGQFLYAVGRSDPAAVAVGLFLVVLAGFELYRIEGIQFAIVADRRQIGGGKADGAHRLFDAFKQALPVVAVPAEPDVALDSGFRNQPEVSRIDRLNFIIR